MRTLIVLVIIVGLVLAAAALYWKRDELDGLGKRLWDFIVRLRTWLLGMGGAALLVLPDLLSSVLHDPDAQAILPEQTQHWIGVAALMLTVLSRPRPATRSNDAEVKVAKALKAVDTNAQVMIAPNGGAISHTIQVPPKGGV